MIEHPIVFISYSWDDENHKEWVLRLANKLRTNGVDVILDRYHLRPGKNVSVFVEESMRNSNRIIIVLTPNYKLKAEKRIGGVGQEFSMINNELVQNISGNERVVPILKTGSPNESIPDFLQQYIYINFNIESEFETNYESLLRELFKEPEITIPKLGQRPQFNSAVKPIENDVSVLNKVIEESAKLSTESKDTRKEASSEIYLLGSTLPISEIISLVDSGNLNYQIAAAICLKSIVENLEIDLGSNPQVRRFVTLGLNHESSFLRYRIMDLVSVSEILQQEFDDQLKRLKTKENNEVVDRKLDSIIHENTESTDVRYTVKNLVAQGKIKQALEELSHYTDKNNLDINSDVIALQARLSSLYRDKNMGILNLENVTRTTNQINQGLLYLLDNM